MGLTDSDAAFWHAPWPQVSTLMRYSLLTLWIVMLLSGPALAFMWWWPGLAAVAGSALLTLAVALGSLWLHQWQRKRLAIGKRSTAAAGVELSILLCFVLASFGAVWIWIECLFPRLAK